MKSEHHHEISTAKAMALVDRKMQFRIALSHSDPRQHTDALAYCVCHTRPVIRSTHKATYIATSLTAIAPSQLQILDARYWPYDLFGRLPAEPRGCYAAQSRQVTKPLYAPHGRPPHVGR